MIFTSSQGSKKQNYCKNLDLAAVPSTLGGHELSSKFLQKSRFSPTTQSVVTCQTENVFAFFLVFGIE
jgi:hypothetical protein